MVSSSVKMSERRDSHCYRGKNRIEKNNFEIAGNTYFVCNTHIMCYVYDPCTNQT